MSPEQLTDTALTAASDMFSWAGTMVFAATGRLAFPGRAVPAILHAILSGQADLSGVPDPLRSLVAACLAKDSAARPAAGRLLRDLTGDHQTDHEGDHQGADHAADHSRDARGDPQGHSPVRLRPGEIAACHPTADGPHAYAGQRMTVTCRPTVTYGHRVPS
jgi:hypothetical protein